MSNSDDDALTVSNLLGAVLRHTHHEGMTEESLDRDFLFIHHECRRFFVIYNPVMWPDVDSMEVGFP